MISSNNAFLKDPVSLALFRMHLSWMTLAFSSSVCNVEESAVRWPQVIGIITDKIQASPFFVLFTTQLPEL